ncbi:hypothetical protein ERJ75_000079800 [Trypanosoma vivax]|nr:hypothetical protein ERJ75_000079800 [Trypanosoma vivax]
MLAMRLCFLLLLSLCAVLCVNCRYDCPESVNRDKSPARMCAAQDLLWGWLNVTNKTAVRAEKVKQNATKLRDRLGETEVKAQKSLEAANNVLVRLKETKSEKFYTVHRALETLKNVISRMNTSRKEAISAEKNANSSMNAAVNGYGAILMAAKIVSGNNNGEEIFYEKTLEKIGMIKIGENGVCPEQLFVSGNLTEMANKIDVMRNLSEWKSQTLKLLNSTYNQITQNKSTCHRTFNNGPEKFEGVKDAINIAVEKLEAALREFGVADSTLQQAVQNVESATNDVQTVNATVLGLFRQNGRALCEMLKRHLEMDTQLHATAKLLESTKLQVVSTENDSAHLLSNAIEESRAVQSVVDEILNLLKIGPRSLFSSALFASGNATLASESVVRFENVASLSAQNATRAKGSTADVEGQMKNGKQTIEHLKEQLIARLSEARLNTNNLTADECNKKFSEVSDSSWDVAFDRALDINVNALLETNRTLKQLEVQIKLIESNLTEINSNVDDITATMSNAVQIRETAKAAAATAVADVLRSLIKEMCVSATELHELRKKNNGFKSTVEVLRNSVSVESRRAEAAWKRDSAMSEIPHDVGDGFTYASRSVAMLEKQLQRVDAQYAKVASELEKELTKPDGGDAKIYIAVVNFLRDINSNLTALSLPSVCSGDRVDEVVTLLVNDKDAMLKNVSAIVSLGELAAKVRERVTAARDQMKKIVSSAADAQAAVEEAIRRARDANAGRRCTPLHRQLLNLLQHIW